MIKKFGVVLLAVLFIGSMAWAPIVSTVDADTKCECGKDCKCDHSATGKGECNCKDGKNGEGCGCGKDCKCEHSKTGEANCNCKAGDKGCQCGKDCQCGHCKTGEGNCNCKIDGKGGCKCGKDCKCAHCTAGAQVKPTDDAAYAKTMVSKAGTFKVTYTSDPEAVPVGDIHSWKLKIETSDGKPVKNAKITISGTMPEHGHGMPTQPKVTKNYGDGTYLVEGMKFSMPGWWLVNFSIKAGGKKDIVTYNLKLQ